MDNPFDPLFKDVKQINPVRHFGHVTDIHGLMLKCSGLTRPFLGQRVSVEKVTGERIWGDVVALSKDVCTVMPFGSMEGISIGSKVIEDKAGHVAPVSAGLVGRVINALGEPIDGKGALPTVHENLPLKASAPNPRERQSVGRMLDTGVRVLNTFLPFCAGQRMAIFSGSGVGKSVLMSMVAKYSEADINVIGLIGERGREVREFVEEQLGEEGLKRSVVIVATGDESPMMRRQAAYLTLTVAEYFRNHGKNVMLFMDSVTRFAMAQREIGLSVGEPPTTRGYPPSVFSELPRLLERAGPGREGEGTITALFTVLVEGGDMDEPVADAVRGIVDGHIVLERKLAEKGHFPAVQVLKSISRMAPQCYDEEQHLSVTEARSLLSTYNDMEELIRLGAYKEGSDPKTDKAIRHMPKLESFLKQAPKDHTAQAESFSSLADALKGNGARPMPKQNENVS
jgi:flagellum-specific ATP synthase